MTTTGPATDAAQPTTRYRNTLWTREHRVATLGLVLMVTLVAFEFMGVATALPTLVADLHGGRLYAWPIAAFTAASAIGTVLAGRICDRSGPARPLIGAFVLFAVGLLIGGTAHSMAVLLAGRVVQGFGAGAAVCAVYVVIALVYPSRDRPAASALLAASWVVPALVGPLVAGVVTQAFGWRWVFLGLVPLVALGLPMLLHVVHGLPPHQPSGAAPRRGLVVAAIGAAVGVTVFTAAVQHLTVVTAPFALAGLVVLGFALRRLLPRGTAHSRRGLPSVVLGRGLLAGSFAAVETFIPLALTSVHGYTPATAGLPLTVSALGWSAASAWQGRHTEVSRSRLLQAAFLLSGTGLATIAVIAWQWSPAWLAIPAWTVAGAGMGLGVSSISVLLFEQSPVADRGFNTSSVQLADMIGTVLLVGVGGVLVNALGSTARPSLPLFVFDGLMCAVAVFGAIVPAGRTAVRLP